MKTPVQNPRSLNRIPTLLNSTAERQLPFFALHLWVPQQAPPAEPRLLQFPKGPSIPEAPLITEPLCNSIPKAITHHVWLYKSQFYIDTLTGLTGYLYGAYTGPRSKDMGTPFIYGLGRYFTSTLTLWAWGWPQVDASNGVH